MKLFKPLAVAVIMSWWYPPADTGITNSGSSWCVLDFLSYIPNAIGSYTHDLYQAEALQITDKFEEVQQLIYVRDTMYTSLQAQADIARSGTMDPALVESTMEQTGVDEVTEMEKDASRLWFTSLVSGATVCLDKIVMVIALIVYRIGWWATIVAMLGKSDVRVWNSFFLQYLWEFVLGMYLAKCYKLNSEIVNLLNFKILVPVCILCVAFTGVAGLKGGIWKLYNDIPSMIGYLFTLLIIYKLHIKPINGLFVLTNKISYEWYLVHMLVFSCTFYYLYKLETFGMVAIAVISFIFSYVVACLYHWILSKMKIF